MDKVVYTTSAKPVNNLNSKPISQIPKSKNNIELTKDLYEFARKVELSPHLILYVDNNFVDFITYFKSLFENGMTLQEIYDYVKDSNISSEDVIAVYYGYFFDENDRKSLSFISENSDIKDFFNEMYLIWENFNIKYEGNNYDLFDFITFLRKDYSILDIFNYIKNNYSNIEISNILTACYYLLIDEEKKNAENVLEKETGYIVIIDPSYKSYDEWKGSVLSNNMSLIELTRRYSNDRISKLFDKPEINDVWLLKLFLNDFYEKWNIINIHKYDEDTTLFHKWRYRAQKRLWKFPLRLSLSRPRQNDDGLNTNGTEKMIFESIIELVQQNVDPKELYQYIIGYNRLIDAKDIAMIYYELNKGLNEGNIEAINKFYKDMGFADKAVIQNDISLQSEYDDWKGTVDREINIDDQNFQFLLDVNKEFIRLDTNNVADIMISPIKIISTIKSYTPRIFDLSNSEGRFVVKEDGYDIFNNTIISQYIPFVCYNDNYEKTVYKVFTPRESDVNYEKYVLKPDKTTEKNTIYMTLWLGDPNEISVTRSPQKYFYTIIYHIDGNKLTIESTARDALLDLSVEMKNLAYNRVQMAFPNLALGEGIEIKVRGDFRMWNAIIDETSFLDNLLTERMLNHFLYVEEDKGPYPLKKHLGIDLHYKQIFVAAAKYAAVSPSIMQFYSTEDEASEILQEDGTIVARTFPAGTPYLQVNVLQAESRPIVDKFIKIFRLLIMYYMEKESNEDNTKSDYDKELPGLVDRLNELLAEQRLILIKPKKSKKTINEASELFVGGYTKLGCGVPPFLIDPEDVDFYESEGKQVMPFPKNNPKWNFVCPDSKPFPGVKVNDKLPNKDEFPYIPCCYKKDKMTPLVNGKKNYNKYQQYLENDEIIESSAKGNNIIRNPTKSLSPNIFGYLPGSVENIINKYSSRANTKMYRFGTTKYPINSLLHCICFAVDDFNYISLNSDEKKEEYVKELKKYIFNNVNHSVMKQELYDYTDQEVADLFENTFFDPALIYRAVEEIFNINVYVFTYGNGGELEVPRCKIFHSRPPRTYRPTVLIAKIFATSKKRIEGYNVNNIPKCELIVNYDDEKSRIIKYFGESMTSICHDIILQNDMNTITISQEQDHYIVRDNVYYHLDHMKIYNDNVVSQFIDAYGKMRALNLNIKGNLITVVVPPSQPENLPISNTIDIIQATIANQIFGNPVGITRDVSGKVDGYWYQVLDIKYGEYVPVIPYNDNNNLNIGPNNPLGLIKPSVTGRLRKLQRTLNIVVELVRWCYGLLRLKGQTSPYIFQKEYLTVINKPNVDSANYYDLSKIRRRLPDIDIVDDIDGAINYMHNIAPTLFGKNKIIMYNQEFSNRIKSMLVDYDNMINNRYIEVKEFINKFYETAEDFVYSPNTKIFLSRTELDNWIKSLKITQKQIQLVYSTTEIAKSLLHEPYIYQSDDIVYIIQNSIEDSANKALTIAKTWRDKHINIGINIEIDKNDLKNLPYFVYGISSDSKIIPIDDKSNGRTDYVEILYYGSQAEYNNNSSIKYAAMLPIY